MLFSAIYCFFAIFVENVSALKTLIILYGATVNTTLLFDEFAALDVHTTKAILNLLKPFPTEIKVALTETMCTIDFDWVLKNYQHLGWTTEEPSSLGNPNTMFDRILHLGPLCEYYATESAEFEMVNYMETVMLAYNSTSKKVAHFFASPSTSVNMMMSNLNETVNLVAKKWNLSMQSTAFPPFFVHLTSTTTTWGNVLFKYGVEHVSNFTILMSAVDEVGGHVDVFCRNLFDKIMIQSGLKLYSNFTQFTFVGKQSEDDFLEIWHLLSFRTRRIFFCGDSGLFHGFLMAGKRLKEVDHDSKLSINDFGIYYILFGTDDTNRKTWPMLNGKINQLISKVHEASYHVKIISLNAPLKCGRNSETEKFCQDFDFKILHNHTNVAYDPKHDKHSIWHSHSRFDPEATFYALAIHRLFVTAIMDSTNFWRKVENLEPVTDLLKFDAPAISVYDILPNGNMPRFKLLKKCEFSELGIVLPSGCMLDWNGSEPYGDPTLCGYQNCTQPQEATWKLVVGIFAAVIGTGMLSSLLVVCVYLRHKKRQEWIVKAIGEVCLKIEDIKPLTSLEPEAAPKLTANVEKTAMSALNSPKNVVNSEASKGTFSKSFSSRICLNPRTLASVPGVHTTALVLVKPFKCYRNQERQVTEIVTKYRELNLENVAKIHGYVMQAQPFLYGLVVESGEHGALIDLLELNELDLTLKMPLLVDLCRGLEHIHKNSLLKYHGNLSSQCCIVDSHFQLKIQLNEIRELKKLSPVPLSSVDQCPVNASAFSTSCAVDGSKSLGSLWTAPEIIRQQSKVDVKLADIYSFGIIAHEIIYQKGPFYLLGKDVFQILLQHPDMQTPKNLGDRAKFVEKLLQDKNMRPIVPSFIGQQLEEPALAILKEVMLHCWVVIPGQRWPLKKISQEIKKAMDDLKIVNVFGNMLQRLDFYSMHLQEAIQAKTEQMEDERRRVRTILDRLFPGGIAKKLIDNQRPLPKVYPSVCVYYNDIVGFTKFCAVNDAHVVVNYLNELFTGYDQVIELYDIHPVTRIGDAYMLVAGIPHESKAVDQAMEIAQAALQMVEVVKRLEVDKDAILDDKDSRCMKIRSGIASGNAAAGVVGKEIPSYCICGPAVTIANKMESNSQPYRILVAESAFNLLKHKFNFQPMADPVIINDDLGSVNAYWMNGMKNVTTIGLEKRLDGKQFKKISEPTVASSHG